MAIFDVNNNNTEAFELKEHLVKNGINDVQFVFPNKVVVKNCNNITKLFNLVQSANNEMLELFGVGSFVIDATLVNNEITITETAYD